MINFDSYRFTKNWVNGSHLEVPGYWSSIVKNNEYKKMLEIGSYEGRSTLHFIDSGIKEIYCIDVWTNIKIHNNFNYNMRHMKENYGITYYDYKGYSWEILGEWQSKFLIKFDIIYVDGSHFPHNTLIDACLSFRLLKVGGCIIFDDYGWIRKTRGPAYLTPKIGIDAFERTHDRFIKPATVHPHQKAWYKVAEMDNFG